MADEPEPNPRIVRIIADIARARTKRADAQARLDQLDEVIARLEELLATETAAAEPTPPEP
jgi:hypothetical protein